MIMVMLEHNELFLGLFLLIQWELLEFWRKLASEE